MTDRSLNLIASILCLCSSTRSPDAPHLTLRYFDIRGKGELLRLLLEDVGAKYDDVRFQRAEWFATVKKQYVESGT